MDRVGLSGGEQHRRRLGVTLQFDVGIEGQLWRVRSSPAAAREWPIRHWVAQDFIAGCPTSPSSIRGQVPNYVGILSNPNPAFARAWSHYRRIAAFDGLVVYRRAATGCIDPWVAAEASRATDTR